MVFARRDREPTYYGFLREIIGCLGGIGRVEESDCCMVVVGTRRDKKVICFGVV